MFIKERDWILDHAPYLELGGKFSVLDIGSSSLVYRRQKQPYIDSLYEHFKKLGGKVVTLDFDKMSDADYPIDISDPKFPDIGEFDMVLATNILEHIKKENFDTAIKNIKNVTGKWLIVTMPLFYVWHFQPVDNGYRLTPEEIIRCFGSDMNVLSSASWQDENYAEPYKSDDKYPKPWVSGVIFEKVV